LRIACRSGGLALDHGDGCQPAAASCRQARRTINGHPADGLTRDDVLDDITLYWLDQHGGLCGSLLLGKQGRVNNAADISIPAAVSVFPGENYQPREAGPSGRITLIYFNEVDKGGTCAGTAATVCRRGSRGLTAAAQIDLKRSARAWRRPPSISQARSTS
jgi:hypothetical protein